jgi:hypothetical protein
MEALKADREDTNAYKNSSSAWLQSSIEQTDNASPRTIRAIWKSWPVQAGMVKRCALICHHLANLVSGMPVSQRLKSGTHGIEITVCTSAREPPARSINPDADAESVAEPHREMALRSVKLLTLCK